jgi:DNA invertase Pin-like site-specific DNA recombinase
VKAKRQGKYRGRQIDQKLHNRIVALLRDNYSVRKTADLAGCSPGTVQRVKKLAAETDRSNPLKAPIMALDGRS